MSYSTSPLLCEPSEKDQREADNGVEQIDYITYLIQELKIQQVRESHIIELHKQAIQNIYPCGGQYRDAVRKVTIEGSAHRVPHESLVPSLVRDFIGWINRNQGNKSALERAAYSLWRLNWIHPFAGGNGRTARALTYLILCMDMGMMLPGAPSVPTLLYGRRIDYVDALRAADAGEKDESEPDLSKMTELLQDVVTRQLASAIASLSASGGR